MIDVNDKEPSEQFKSMCLDCLILAFYEYLSRADVDQVKDLKLVVDDELFRMESEHQNEN